MSERRVHEAAGKGLPCSSGTTVQLGVGTGRSKHYPSDSVRTLLEECWADNPPVQLDPHQQLTGMSSDQMIHIVGAIGLEVSLTILGMLEDVLLKPGRKTRKNIGDKGSRQLSLFSCAGSTVIESVASRSFYSLPTITESFVSDPLADDPSQQLCSSWQGVAALGFSQTQVTDSNHSDSLKPLRVIRSDARNKSNL